MPWGPFQIEHIIRLSPIDEAALKRIELKIDALNQTVGSFLLLAKDMDMATKTDFTAVHDDILAKLATIQANIAALKTQADGGGMSADDENAALAQMQEVQAAVSAIANPPAPPATDTPAPTT